MTEHLTNPAHDTVSRDEPAGIGVIVPASQVVQSALLVILVTSVADGVLSAERGRHTARDKPVACPGVVEEVERISYVL